MLVKAKGKCTTDHISPAGPWLRYRGHLTKISENMFTGARNAFADEKPGLGVDVRDGSVKPIPDLAKEYKTAGISPRMSYLIEKRPFYVTRDGQGKPIDALLAKAGV